MYKACEHIYLSYIKSHSGIFISILLVNITFWGGKGLGFNLQNSYYLLICLNSSIFPHFLLLYTSNLIRISYCDKHWHTIWGKEVPNRISHSASRPELCRTVNVVDWIAFCPPSKSYVVADISQQLVEDFISCRTLTKAHHNHLFVFVGEQLDKKYSLRCIPGRPNPLIYKRYNSKSRHCFMGRKKR